jgi:hypothetical protein
MMTKQIEAPAEVFCAAPDYVTRTEWYSAETGELIAVTDWEASGGELRKHRSFFDIDKREMVNVLYPVRSRGDAG